VVRITYVALAEWVVSLMTPKRTLLIGVDGPAGSGKSSFARNLSAALPGSVTVPLDDFISWDQLQEWWPRFEIQVLLPIREGREIRYQRRDWDSDPLGSSLCTWRAITAGRVVMIEGVTACRWAISEDLALGVWVSAPIEVRMARGIERDGPHMEGQWCDWMRREQEFFDADQTKSRCQIFVDGTASTDTSSFIAADTAFARELES
jgi:uridine kinase